MSIIAQNISVDGIDPNCVPGCCSIEGCDRVPEIAWMPLRTPDGWLWLCAICAQDISLGMLRDVIELNLGHEPDSCLLVCRAIEALLESIKTKK